MRNFARLCLTGVAIACSAMLLSGCVTPDPVVTPAPTSSSKPPFASDEDALAAATKAYAAYLKMSDLILSEGGVRPTRIDELASGDALKGELKSFQNFREKGYRSVGSSNFTNPLLQEYSDDLTSATDVIKIYVCLEISNVNVLDSSGESVVSSSRPNRQAFEISFDRASTTSKTVVVSSTEAWPKKGVCI